MLGDEAPKRFRLAIDILAVLTAAALLLSSYLFYDRITTSRKSQSNTIAAIRTVLCFAQQQAETDPTVTPNQRRRATRFYTQALKRIDALPCTPILRKEHP